MAKEHKHAGLICLILAVLALSGAVIGVIKTIPILVICTTIPVALYEIYRTEGLFTKIFSIAIFAGLIAELLIILGKFNFATAKIADYASKKTAKYQAALKHLSSTGKNTLTKASLMDMRLIVPALIVILSLLLLRRTGGIYTRLLAALLLVCSLALAAAVKPELLKLVFG